MDDDIREEIQEIKKLTEENNEILLSIQRKARFTFFFKLLYWLVIIGIAAGAFYFIKPYIEAGMQFMDSVKETQVKINGFSSDSIDKFKSFFSKD